MIRVWYDFLTYMLTGIKIIPSSYHTLKYPIYNTKLYLEENNAIVEKNSSNSIQAQY